MFQRFDDDARAVLAAARDEARALGHRLVGTEHVLLGLTAVPGPVARLLAGHGVTPGPVRGGVAARLVRDASPGPTGAAAPAGPSGEGGHPDDAALLGTLGIDLEAVRRNVEAAFGPDAVRAAIAAAGPSRPAGAGRAGRRGRRAWPRPGGGPGGGSRGRSAWPRRLRRRASPCPPVGPLAAASGAVHGPPWGPRAKRVLEAAHRAGVRRRPPVVTPAHLLVALLTEGEGLACAVLADLGTPLPGLEADARALTPGAPGHPADAPG
jgi:Clp amino terminal domain, pathogenicity island component